MVEEAGDREDAPAAVLAAVAPHGDGVGVQRPQDGDQPLCVAVQPQRLPGGVQDLGVGGEILLSTGSSLLTVILMISQSH